MVVVLTWNANNSLRWQQLWGDPFVLAFNWDVICLQEAGAPAAEWGNPIVGPQWRVDTNKDVVFRIYQYIDLLGAMLPNRTVYIIHCEWVKRQRNHTVIITKTRAYPISLAGDVGIRPCLGIHMRLRYADGTIRRAVLGCVHIVSSDKAPQEVREMLQYINAMVAQKTANGWLLFGDFNADPNAVAQAANCYTTYYPGPTQKNQPAHPLDYGAFNNLALLTAASSLWYRGTAMSDHCLMKYEQTGGPTVLRFLP